MAQAYFYSNTAVETTLTGSVSNSATLISVGATTGFPTSTPYVLAIGYGASDEELVKVTAAAGTSLTVERGFGDTSAQSHSLGAKVRHVVNAQDLTDFRQHEDDATGAHGVTGTVVGTSDTQTLSNKTLTSPAISGPTVTGGGSLAGTFTGAPEFSGNTVHSGDPSFTGSPTFTASATDSTTYSAPGVNDRVMAVKLAAETDVRLWVAGDGSLYWEDGAGTDQVALGRLEAGTLATFDQFRILRGTTAEDALQTAVNGEAGLRFMIEAGGRIMWNDGTDLTMDTELLRTGPGALQTNATFDAQTETSATFSVAAGFSLNKAVLRKTCGVCSVTVEVTVDNGIATSSSSSPNIVDTVMGTLPAGYIPTDNFEASWSTGLESGSAQIGPAGVITLRTSDYSTGIPTGSTLRVSATYVL